MTLTKKFYEALGLEFCAEKHGNGPGHYSASCGETVFEIYPLQPRETPTKNRLGFCVGRLDRAVENLRVLKAVILAAPTPTDQGLRAIARDPEGRIVELYEKPA